ncbi:MAG: MotA/TolQ/ExbB proton channel family protein [Gammaproteobacteria bacterium]|nr:MotA/TolQ/ExbB proton channel family protein [Gammaproteobacteria bacterium]
MMTIQQEFLSLMERGGPIMWIIFFVACSAMTLVVWEAIRGHVLIKSARRDYARLRSSNDNLLITSGNMSPVAQLLATIHWPNVQSKEDIAREINIHLPEIIPKMEGSLATIAILGSLLPMLGLLGTVTGMINVFEVIALHGSGQPDEMAEGISQALLTTASGLIIAIPVIFLHHLLSRRINVLVAMTHQAIQLILHRDVSTLKKAALERVPYNVN